jgi:hypothetical protein
VGGTDSRLHSADFKWLDVNDKMYWQVDMEDILVDGKPMHVCPPKGCKVAMDTGTSLITGPSQDMHRLLNYAQAYTSIPWYIHAYEVWVRHGAGHYSTCLFLPAAPHLAFCRRTATAVTGSSFL